MTARFFAGAELSLALEGILNIFNDCCRVRATKHAPRGPFPDSSSVVNKCGRKDLAEIECVPITPPHPERELMRVTEKHVFTGINLRINDLDALKFFVSEVLKEETTKLWALSGFLMFLSIFSKQNIRLSHWQGFRSFVQLKYFSKCWR